MPDSRPTAKIINLKQVRKQREQAQKERVAEANRKKFGRSKGDKQRDKQKTEKADSHLDGHKLDASADSNPEANSNDDSKE